MCGPLFLYCCFVTDNPNVRIIVYLALRRLLLGRGDLRQVNVTDSSSQFTLMVL